MRNIELIKNRRSERGNTVVIVLVVLVVAAVGAMAFLSGKIGPQKDGAESAQTATAEPASGNDAAATQTAQSEQQAPAAPQIEIKDPQGNPVVAKIGRDEITRGEVFGYIQTLSPNARQLPIDQLFPMAVNQVVNTQVIGKQVQSANLDNDPAVKEQLEVAKDQIKRRVYVQQQIEKAMTDERLKAAYDQLVENFPEIEEVKTRHILVEEEKTAKEIVKQLKDGADFAELAKEKSIDPTKENGGELDYIAKQDQIVPEYLEAAFDLKQGEVSKPVKSQFGYHIIELQDKRIRPVPPFDGQTKAFLANQLTAQVLNELVEGWRAKSDVTVLDINGEALEPAAGDEAPAEAPAEN